MYEFKSLNKLLDYFAQMGTPSFDIEVRHRGKTVMRRMHGYSDVGKTKPIDGTEKYHIYSCSKPITCVAAMTLFEKGKFSLQDKLSAYMPEFSKMYVREGDTVREAKNPITIENLFTMTAGFTYDLRSKNLMAAREETGGACATRETMKYLAKDPLAFEPGERFSYSLCHDVIAAFVEVVSGEKFGDYVKRNVFDRAGMTNSTFLPDKETLDSLCAQYRYHADKREYEYVGSQNNYNIGTEYESGGAGCVTTVDDYMKFLEALRVGNTVISRETVKYMATNKLLASQNAEYGLWSLGYGYGLGIRCPLDNSSASTDFGWGGAAAAFLACDIKHEFSVYYAQHVLMAPNQSMRIKIPEYIRADLEGKDDNGEIFESQKTELTY